MNWKKLPLVRPLIQLRYKFGQTPIGKQALYGAKTRKIKRLAAQGKTTLKPFTNPVEPKYNLSIFCRIYNEGRFIQEFIAYHLGVGVEHFYLYDNASKDDTKEKLQPFIDRGVVTLVDFPLKPPSPHADLDCVQRFRQETKWMACIDADEFLLPMQCDDVKEVLKEFENDAALMVCWRYFGSSGHKKRPDDLVIEAYQHSSPRVVETLKTIMNPRLAAEYGNSHFWFFGGDAVPVDENHHRVYGGTTLKPSGEKIRINHYYCKSEEDFMAKISPDYAVDAFAKHGNTRTLENLKRTFERHNDVLDTEIQRFVQRTKDILAEYTQ